MSLSNFLKDISEKEIQQLFESERQIVYVTLRNCPDNELILLREKVKALDLLEAKFLAEQKRKPNENQ